MTQFYYENLVRVLELSPRTFRPALLAKLVELSLPCFKNRDAMLSFINRVIDRQEFAQDRMKLLNAMDLEIAEQERIKAQHDPPQP